MAECSAPVLFYETVNSAWTDELAVFHDEKAGATHFIDVASREYALNQLERFASSPAPVILEAGCSSDRMDGVPPMGEKTPHYEEWTGP